MKRGAFFTNLEIVVESVSILLQWLKWLLDSTAELDLQRDENEIWLKFYINKWNLLQDLDHILNSTQNLQIKDAKQPEEVTSIN